MKILIVLFIIVAMFSCTKDEGKHQINDTSTTDVFKLPEVQVMLKEYIAWLDNENIKHQERLTEIKQKEKDILDFLNAQTKDSIKQDLWIKNIQKIRYKNLKRTSLKTYDIDYGVYAFSYSRYINNFQYVYDKYDRMRYEPYSQEDYNRLNYLSWHDLGLWVYTPYLEMINLEDKRTKEESFDMMLPQVTVFGKSLISNYIRGITAAIVSTSYTIYGSPFAERAIINRLKMKNLKIGMIIEWVYPRAQGLTIGDELSFGLKVYSENNMYMQDFFFEFLELMDQILWELWDYPKTHHSKYPHYNYDLCYFNMDMFFYHSSSSSSGSGSSDNAYKPKPDIIETELFLNNEKLKDVWTTLSASNNSMIKSYVKKFDGEFPVAHLKLGIDSLMHKDVMASTYPPYNYIIEIIFNPNFIEELSKTEIARNIIHEIIHAEMYRKLLSIAPTSSYIDQEKLEEALNNHNFPGLLDYYVRYMNDGSMNSVQHNLMADHYLNIMEEAIITYNPDVNMIFPDAAQALAWKGLQGTDAWNALSQSERDHIKFIQDSYSD